jgi:hypothetical protein
MPYAPNWEQQEKERERERERDTTVTAVGHHSFVYLQVIEDHGKPQS